MVMIRPFTKSFSWHLMYSEGIHITKLLFIFLLLICLLLQGFSAKNLEKQRENYLSSSTSVSNTQCIMIKYSTFLTNWNYK